MYIVCVGVYLVPAFGGLLAPHWQDDARGVILGLTSYTTKAHIVRAMLEAIAWQVSLTVLHGNNITIEFTQGTQ